MTRVLGLSLQLKSGNYAFSAGITPYGVLQKVARGDVNQYAITIIEGWTFRRMRDEINANPMLRHDSASLSDAQLMHAILAGIASTDPHQTGEAPARQRMPKLDGARSDEPEGLFFPDTYLFDKHISDLDIFRRAYRLMHLRVQQAWDTREPGLPYTTPYDALKMASIIEKETGHTKDRPRVAAVFVNRLRLSMPLQTDPTVIYGLGACYGGRLRKRDLQTDTPYNTYMRGGLPPTPIALPGNASLQAALHPAASGALYFVARGDGRSHFSDNLGDHNKAVDKYIRDIATRRNGTFEGIDGAGKTTHLAWFRDRLSERAARHGASVVMTREPGGTSLGETLREILLRQPMHLETEALLMFAARREHIAAVIEPTLACGDWVLSDRFTDATFAYQGGGRGLPIDKLQVLEHWVQAGLQPDRTVLFDVPTDTARARRGGARAPDKFEGESDAFFVRTRAEYLRRAAQASVRFAIVDSTRPIAEMPYPWQYEGWARIQSLRGHWPHALLLHGQAGIGKVEFARELAQGLLCERAYDDGRPCGQCAACTWLVQGNHPDFRLVCPEAMATAAAPVQADGDTGKSAKGGRVTDEDSGKKSKAPSKEIKIEQ
ncbi:hypothetical protein DFQ30_010577, partial [Apophysomyces sp. BC1015]